MMPKGVEHLAALRYAYSLAHVKIPMMPKGVEHAQGWLAICLALSEDSNDAERR